MVKIFTLYPKFVSQHGITHFLRIPFATQKSTPQLLASINHVARDPIASALPRIASKTPDQLQYSVGMLSLTTPARMKAAVQLLKTLHEQYQPKHGVRSRAMLQKCTARPFPANDADSRSSYTLQSVPLHDESGIKSHEYGDTGYVGTYTDSIACKRPSQLVSSKIRLAHPPVIALRGLCRPFGHSDYPITRHLICRVTEPRPFLQ